MIDYVLARSFTTEDRLQWFGWVLIFACFYILPRSIQNASFFIGLIIVLFEARHSVIKIAFKQKLFAIVCGVMSVVTCAQNVAGITSPAAAAETIGSIVTIYLFVLAVATCRLDMRHFFLLIASLAVIGAAIGWFISKGPLVEGVPFRLSMLGKGRNPIQAGALLAVGIFALISVNFDGRWRNIGRALAITFLASTLLATFSRGPIISFVIALLFCALLSRFPMKYAGGAFVISVFISWFIIVAVVLWGDALKPTLCVASESFCRGSERQDIWGWVWEKVRENPFLGNGASFRFFDPSKPHAHNGVFGLMMGFGLPSATLFLVVCSVQLIKFYQLDADTPSLFIKLSILFAAAYMGSDLTTPFAFIGAQYVFFWLPYAFILRALVASSHEVN